MKPPVIKVVSTEDAEAADFVVCMLEADNNPPFFPDNLKGACHDCGRTVVFRPTGPKRPPKVCLACATERIDGGRA